MLSLDQRQVSFVERAFRTVAPVARSPRAVAKGGGVGAVVSSEVLVSLQYDGAFRLVTDEPFEVSADAASRYGYADSIPDTESVTVLDVVVEAHRRIYGEAFTRETAHNYLEIGDYDAVRRIVGEPGRYTYFVINGHYIYDAESEYQKIGFTGLTQTNTPVYDYDVVEIFSFSTSRMGMDYYTYFTNPSGRHEYCAMAHPGEPITIKQEGFYYAYAGPLTHKDRRESGMVRPIVGSQLAVIDPITKQLTDVPEAISDGEGLITFSFAEPGFYYITAHGGKAKRKDANKSLPWLPVIIG